MPVGKPFQKGCKPGPGRKAGVPDRMYRRYLDVPWTADYDFKEDARRLLPLATQRLRMLLQSSRCPPSLIPRAYELLRDTVHGRPHQTVSGVDGGPLLLAFTQLLDGIDGTKHERFDEAEEIEAIVSNGTDNGHALPEAGKNGGNGNGKHP